MPRPRQKSKVAESATFTLYFILSTSYFILHTSYFGGCSPVVFAVEDAAEFELDNAEHGFTKD